MIAPINHLSIKPMYLPPLPLFTKKSANHLKKRINYKEQKSTDKYRLL